MMTADKSKPRTVKPSKIIAQAIAMRQAGMTCAVISDKLNVSCSTANRWFQKYNVPASERGSLDAEVVKTARDDLLANTDFMSDIKQSIAATLQDDLQQYKNMRQATRSL